MLFFLLFVFVHSQFLSNFSSYTINFHTGHKEYLLFQSENTTLYLCEQNGSYVLFVADFENHEIYSSTTQENLKFSYDGTFKINGEAMELIISQGYVNIKRNFTEFYLAPIKTVSASNLDSAALQVCYNFSTERLWLKTGLVLACFLIVISNHGFIKTAVEPVLQRNFSRRFSWSRNVLSRGEIKIPQTENESGV